MDLRTINYIKTKPLIYNYLRVNSTLYKDLLREPNNIKKVEQLSKEYFKQTPQDKIEKIRSNIEMISSIIDIFY